MTERRRKFWGWGWEDEGPTPEQQGRIAELLAGRFGLGPIEIRPPPKLEEITLRPPRVQPPVQLARIASSSPYDRSGHTYGKSFRDVVRAYARDFSNPPDFVAFPRSED